MHTFVALFFVLGLIGLIREGVMMYLGKYPEPVEEITLRRAVRTSLIGVALVTWAGFLLFA